MNNSIPNLKFWLVLVYNSRGQYCDWHYLATEASEDPALLQDEHDRITPTDESAFVSSYNPRGVQWPQSIRHVYSAAAKKEITGTGQPMGGVVLLGA